MHDLALGTIGRRQVGKVAEPFVADGRLEHLPQSDDFVVKRAARGWLIRWRTIAFDSGFNSSRDVIR